MTEVACNKSLCVISDIYFARSSYICLATKYKETLIYKSLILSDMSAFSCVHTQAVDMSHLADV